MLSVAMYAPKTFDRNNLGQKLDMKDTGTESEYEIIRIFRLDPRRKKSSDLDSDSDPDTVVK
jgi:hypothetical protein